MARSEKALQAFIQLVAKQKSRKAVAETAASFLRHEFGLADCLIVLDATPEGRARSYGDQPHYLSALVLPAQGRGLILPGQMKRQGWLQMELISHRRIGWLLVRIKRQKRSGVLQKRLEAYAGVLALGLDVAYTESVYKKVQKEFHEQLHSSTEQLRRTNNKLIALDETKDEFITMASHQLRTPLTSIKGYVSMVLDGDVGEINDQQRKLLTQAFISSQRMVYLIADLLNMSRLRTGRFVIEKTDTHLPDIVQGELDQLRETAEAKGLKLIYKKPQQFPLMQLDETKIRQVIMNFIDNAIHYTQEGGEIRVELEEKPRSVEFRVIDTGLGVPRADQHKLFSKFFRADNARQSRPDGTGLGLFMAKKVIIAQGGALIFRSTEGKGSTFGFTFPK